MKSLGGIASVAFALLFNMELSAQNPSNPIEDALLRWYPANQVATFSPCSLPQGLAFDGAHMWVACAGTSGAGANGLVELNVSDGTVAGTVTNVPGPYALVYDGANIWASNQNNAQVTKVNTSTPTLQTSTVQVGNVPKGMAFDGANIWVANYQDNTLTEIPVAGGSPITHPLSGCSEPWGIVVALDSSDHVHLWVACYSTNNVVEVDPSNGTITATVGGFVFPTFLAYDGTNIWVTNNGGNGSLNEFSASNPPPSVGQGIQVGSTPYQVIFDTEYIWVANGGSSSVTKVVASTTKEVQGSPFSTGAGTAPQFLAFDGANLWVSSTAGQVSKF
jgi:hypothetical protein